MQPLYVVCLLGGACATAIFAFLGLHSGSGHVSHVAHSHIGHGGHTTAGTTHTGAHGHTEANGHHGNASPSATVHSLPSPWYHHFSGWLLSWISPLTVAAALMWFGGVGLILEQTSLSPVSLIFAIIAGILGAFLIRSVMRAFLGADTPPLMLTGDGALATVNATIRPDRVGEVIYTLEGLARSVPAKSLDGQTIERGTSVAIVKREHGVAWVATLVEPGEG